MIFCVVWKVLVKDKNNIQRVNKERALIEEQWVEGILIDQIYSIIIQVEKSIYQISFFFK
jgi:hypothetical protein